jgi:hypothetical protein
MPKFSSLFYFLQVIPEYYLDGYASFETISMPSLTKSSQFSVTTTVMDYLYRMHTDVGIQQKQTQSNAVLTTFQFKNYLNYLY